MILNADTRKKNLDFSVLGLGWGVGIWGEQEDAGSGWTPWWVIVKTRPCV